MIYRIQPLLLAIFVSINLIADAICYAQEKVTLETVINIAEQNSLTLKAIDQSVRSLESEIKSRDLELSATITSELAAVRDERDRVYSSDDDGFTRGNNGEYALFDNIYRKPFDTGTEVLLGVGQNYYESSPVDRDNNLADWEIRLSQDLWRNSFGRSTSLRRQADKSEFSSRYLNVMSEKQKLLQQIEDSFWDLVIARKEIAIRKVNLDRSIKLNNWMKDRVSKFAAEDTDQLQAESLLSERELDLSIAIDASQNASNALKQLIPEVEPENWIIDLKILEAPRSINSLIFRSELAQDNIQPVFIDTVALDNRVQQLEFEAKRLEDSLSPDLSAYVAYGSTGSDNQFFNSWDNSLDTDSNAARIGVLFSMQLDTELKQDRINFAKLSAESEASRLQASDLQSKVGWQELNRNIDSLSKQVTEARRLSNLQKQKVEAEKLRFEQGRSTTFQLISFELDASVSELRLYRLLANLRKAENKARTFILSAV